MERRCGICGSMDVVEVQGSVLQCKKCGAIFNNEKEYEKVLKKLTEKEDKIAQKEAEEKAAKESEIRAAQKERDRITSAIPYITFTVGDKGNEEGKTMEIILCKSKYGELVVEICGKRTIARNFSVNTVKFLQSDYEYKPSKLVYTGASSGGISMGGFHETQAGYVEHNRSTGNYFITLNINGDENYLIEKIKFSDDIKFIVRNKTGLSQTITVFDKQEMAKAVSEAYKMALDLGLDLYQTKSYTEKKMAPFYPTKGRANSIKEAVELAITTRTADEIYGDAVALYSKDSTAEKKEAIKKFQLITPYKDSAEILNEWAKSEEERKQQEQQLKYEKACKYSSSNTVSELTEAVGIFKELGNYKDAEIKLKGAENNLKNLATKKTKKISIIIAPILLICIGLALYWNIVMVPAASYNDAMTDIQNEDYISAYNKLIELGDYKDSVTQLSLIEEEYQWQILKNTEIGGQVVFGNYEQDGNKDNGTEPIEWIVLEKTSGEMMLLSKYILDDRKYYDGEAKEVTWKDSGIRKWLNSSFCNKAFNDEEIKKIVFTQLEEGVKDYVFLLSPHEIKNKYRRYSIAEETAVVENGSWWLRTDSTYYSNMFVAGDGDDILISLSILNDERYWLTHSNGVRPVIWINLEP